MIDADAFIPSARKSTGMKIERTEAKAAPRTRWVILAIPAFGVLLIVGIWVATLLQLAVDRRETLDDALKDLQRVSVALDQHTTRTLKDIDRLALRIKFEFEDSGKVTLEAIRANNILLPDEIDRVSVINAAGDVVDNTRDRTPYSVADRAYFRRHQAADTAKLDVGEPLTSRMSNQRVVLFSRRLNTVDGRFAGVVALSVRPSAFTSFFQESELGTRGVIMLLGRDGIFRAWRSGDRAQPPPDGRQTRLFEMSAVTPIGSYQVKSKVDGVERLVAYRTLDNYPIVVAVGRSIDDVLEGFYRQRMIYLALAAIATAVIAGFFVVVTLLTIRLGRTGVELRAQRSFLVSLVDNIPVGVSVQDARPAHLGRVVLWNDASEAIFRIRRDDAVGKTPRDFFPPAAAARAEARDRELISNPRVLDFVERIDDNPDGTRRRINVIRAPILDSNGTVEYVISIARDITQEQERADAIRLASRVFETTADAIILSDARDQVIMVNAAFSRLTGIGAGDMLGRKLEASPFGALNGCEYRQQLDQLADKGHFRREVVVERGHGGPLSCLLSASCVRDAGGGIVNYIRVFTDISQLKSSQGELEVLARSLRETNNKLTSEVMERTRAASALHKSNEELRQINLKLQEAQGQVLQSEKLASIGLLAAGVAHEINNPVGYVLSNFDTLEVYLRNLFDMLSAYEAATNALPIESSKTLATLREKIEIDYLREDIPTLMKESREGISRVRKIVRDLRDFSRTDRNQEWEKANLHDGIDSTLNIVSNEIKYKADVVKEYGDLPEIECLPTQLNQVFMNLLVNAAQAITKPRGRIVIRSGTKGDQVWIEFIDDGSGMSPEVRSRVFDPFFTTKPVGKGTGLGLSLTYGIIRKHNGRIDLETEVGVGTTFRLWLPIRRIDDAAGPSTPVRGEPAKALAAA